VTLSHKMLQGHCTQVIVSMVTCQLYSSTVRPVFSHPEKTHQTTATSDCAGMSDTTTRHTQKIKSSKCDKKITQQNSRSSLFVHCSTM